MRRWILLVLMVSAGTARAYYNPERVLEKSFEETDFFFHPTQINPYGIGGFGDVAPGLLQDPLLDLGINPSYPASDSTAGRYLYLNFRSSHEAATESTYLPMPLYAMDSQYLDIRYPSFYVENRKTLEPVISLAALFRPFREKPGPTLGLSYQAISQDEAYYEIPQDIYRSAIGADFSGAPMAEGADIPIVDRYSGDDRMHHQGHFLNLLAAMPVTPALDFGVLAGRVVFDRDGDYGSRNLWEYSQSRAEVSKWTNMTGRHQEYDHWDLSAGVNAKVADGVMVGLMGGHLWGNATQDHYRDDFSTYQYGVVNQGSNWSYWNRASETDQSWEHDGGTTYGGINLKTRLSPDQTLTFYYRRSKVDLDIRLASAVYDTSTGDYRHESDQWTSRSESVSSLNDVRQGSGTRTENDDVAAAALEWRVDDRTTLRLGADYSIQDRKIHTVESVRADRFSDHQYSNQSSQEHWSYAAEERKDLYWDFRARESAFHLPLIFDYRISSPVSLQLGVKRTMRQWKIDDVTLAIFDHRSETWNGNTESRDNFGERYTQPEEKRSEVTTTMLAGLALAPSPNLEIRLLMVPNFRSDWDGTELSDLQWWIDFRLFP